MNDRRAGFTLVEILLVMVMGGVLMGAIYQMLHVQHRLQRHTDSVINRQYTMRTALELMGTELRELSSADGDITATGPALVSFRAFRKLGFVCSASAPGQRMDVWQLGEAFTNAPRDSLLVFDHEEARWRRMRVNGIEAADPNCADGWGGATPTRIRVNSADAERLETINQGAPIRAFTHITYSQELIDGEWVLARRTQNDAEPVPILGPIAPPGQRGLRFRYYDETGDELDPASASTATDTRRIEVLVKGFAPGSIGADLDSLAMNIYLRGNAP